MDARGRINKNTFLEFLCGLEPMRIRMEVNDKARHEYYMSRKLVGLK